MERQALRRACMTSVAELQKEIRAFVTGWTNRCHLFVRTSTKVFHGANRPMSANADHQAGQASVNTLGHDHDVAPRP